MVKLAQFLMLNLTIEDALFMTVAAACMPRFCPNYFGNKKMGTPFRAPPSF